MGTILYDDTLLIKFCDDADPKTSSSALDFRCRIELKEADEKISDEDFQPISMRLWRDNIHYTLSMNRANFKELSLFGELDFSSDQFCNWFVNVLKAASESGNLVSSSDITKRVPLIVEAGMDEPPFYLILHLDPESWRRKRNYEEMSANKKFEVWQSKKVAEMKSRMEDLESELELQASEAKRREFNLLEQLKLERNRADSAEKKAAVLESLRLLRGSDENVNGNYDVQELEKKLLEKDAEIEKLKRDKRSLEAEKHIMKCELERNEKTVEVLTDAVLYKRKKVVNCYATDDGIVGAHTACDNGLEPSRRSDEEKVAADSSIKKFFLVLGIVFTSVILWDLFDALIL